ncbi:MAG: hypothetical protein GWO39_13255, partial [Gammaproteobacteria bacterium]|nr:hypothetical protein [Gemmatimonadota bacterium]NIR98514.1 hypothetical protein [Gammaproteobacteria bacterium]NIT64692.1 hypothetical protein [Gammaproteobacteria bacterium]NIV21650.1 hypothetical protein [Gammaproteobacteria bacterium]NIW76339.1 hypothetical protein [Gemmatimonadota bacterium]
ITTGLKVRAEGPHAEAIARSRWETSSADWDISLEEIQASRLIADMAEQTNAWHGPPWVKEGWFQAYRLLGPAITDAQDKRATDSIHRALMHNAYAGLAERADLERRLIAALTRGCNRMVVGYTLARQFYNDDFSDGIENIGYD